MFKKFFLFVILIMLSFSCMAQEKMHKAKSNVIFIFADDLAYNAISSYGNTIVETPNLDKLAAMGTSFTNAYNMGSWSGAVCTASRSMLQSGMSLWRANENRQKWNSKDSVARAHTWGKMMETAGYQTFMSGKWHVDIPAQEVFQTVSHIRPGMPGDAFDHHEMMSLFDKEVSTGKKKASEIMPNGYNRPLSENDTSWSPTDKSKGGFWEGGKHCSEVLKDDALEFMDLAKKEKKPFFMYLAFNAAHDPRQAPQRFVDKYPLDKIKIPDNYQDDYFVHEEIGVGARLRDEALAPFPRTEFAIKTHLQEYYAIISHMDEQIGLILDGLEEKGLMKNTYIFFTADHGLAIGSHGLMGKQNMYDHSIRVPLIVAGPNVAKGFQDSNDVYLQDIMATSLELAQVSKPAFVEFKSLLPLLQNSQESKQYMEVYGAYLDLQRMIRKDGYKLIVYPKIKKLLLFDLTKDPLEIKNLADDPKYAEKKKILFHDLITLQAKMGDKLVLTKIAFE